MNLSLSIYYYVTFNVYWVECYKIFILQSSELNNFYTHLWNQRYICTCAHGIKLYNWPWHWYSLSINFIRNNNSIQCIRIYCMYFKRKEVQWTYTIIHSACKSVSEQSHCIKSHSSHLMVVMSRGFVSLIESLGNILLLNVIQVIVVFL